MCPRSRACVGPTSVCVRVRVRARVCVGGWVGGWVLGVGHMCVSMKYNYLIASFSPQCLDATFEYM